MIIAIKDITQQLKVCQSFHFYLETFVTNVNSVNLFPYWLSKQKDQKFLKKRGKLTSVITEN